jgi:hypothetical protein
LVTAFKVVFSFNQGKNCLKEKVERTKGIAQKRKITEKILEVDKEIPARFKPRIRVFRKTKENPTEKSNRSQIKSGALNLGKRYKKENPGKKRRKKIPAKIFKQSKNVTWFLNN